jgi:hypothetical protein
MTYKIFLYGPGEPIFMSWESTEPKAENVVAEVWAWVNSRDYLDFSDVEGHYRVRTGFISKVLVRKY